MQTVHEIDVLEQVRALSEHRAPKKVLRTVPFDPEYRAPRSRVPLMPAMNDLLLAPAAKRERVASRITISAALELFRETNPGEFTTREVAEFVTDVGYAARNVVTSVAGRLRKMYFASEVEEVRRERHGKSNEIVWRFAP